MQNFVAHQLRPPKCLSERVQLGPLKRLLLTKEGTTRPVTPNSRVKTTLMSRLVLALMRFRSMCRCCVA